MMLPQLELRPYVCAVQFQRSLQLSRVHIVGQSPMAYNDQRYKQSRLWASSARFHVPVRQLSRRAFLRTKSERNWRQPVLRSQRQSPAATICSTPAIYRLYAHPHHYPANCRNGRRRKSVYSYGRVWQRWRRHLGSDSRRNELTIAVGESKQASKGKTSIAFGPYWGAGFHTAVHRQTRYAPGTIATYKSPNGAYTWTGPTDFFYSSINFDESLGHTLGPTICLAVGQLPSQWRPVCFLRWFDTLYQRDIDYYGVFVWMTRPDDKNKDLICRLIDGRSWRRSRARNGGSCGILLRRPYCRHSIFHPRRNQSAFCEKPLAGTGHDMFGSDRWLLQAKERTAARSDTGVGHDYTRRNAFGRRQCHIRVMKGSLPPVSTGVRGGPMQKASTLCSLGKSKGRFPARYKVAVSRIEAPGGVTLKPEEGMDLEQLKPPARPRDGS